ncbi:methyltransferase domain-containing protein [Frateuria defendens]|uniref:methyltransferase domain-containing protein n=1 Tax=Frateuria defendens TaxID=2219559 RepID=UPI000AAC8C5C|nr:methyltransferase domain-containing protein [Frateuria defendens]
MKTRERYPGQALKESDVVAMADAIVLACGLGNVLDVGSGEGCLVAALLRRDIDAFGLDSDHALVERANVRMPGRFREGDAMAMPFADSSFDVVVSNGCLEWLDQAQIVSALAEMRRVTKRHVVLEVDVAAPLKDAATAGSWGKSRAWWERLCFAAGFRKHPRYYRLNPYESLNHDGERVLIALERIPDAALEEYPLSALEEERGLHMDMLRDTGERSDAHVIRYQWACEFVRPHDRVLDAACGLGYGAHVVRSLTRASCVIGIDGSPYAVDYANRCYAEGSQRGEYVCGFLPEALRNYPDASFDTIISFETLEHVEDPRGLLKEFHRVLTPGGRVIVSVPNDWSDESGEDPNPYHLQVYDLDRLRAEIASDFDVEAAYVQSASQAKVIGQRFVWERKQRELYPVDPATQRAHSAEWWLMVGMKSPFVQAEYSERVFGNVAPSGHPSVRYADEYANPWLGLAMITIGQRASLPSLRNKYVSRVLQESPRDAADYGAALCVRAYALLESSLPDASAIDALLDELDCYPMVGGENRMVLRWRVSLAYVKALLLRARGRLQEALEAFVACAGIDARRFGVHLLTKTTASWYEAGRLALALGRPEQAREHWSTGLGVGRTLLSARVEDIVLRPEHPNLFNHGDGVREYTLAWDNIARCANGLHLLADGLDVDVQALETNFTGEYEVVTRDLNRAREQLKDRIDDLVELRAEFHGRTQRLEAATRDLLDRTNELVEVRETLIERTRALENISVQLEERTRLLEASNTLLVQTQKEVGDLQALLSERTAGLDEAPSDLQDRLSRQGGACDQQAGLRERLGEVCALLVERTSALQLAGDQLVDRTRRLESAQAELAEARHMLEVSQLTLVERTQVLDQVAAELEDRTRRLEALTELTGRAS